MSGLADTVHAENHPKSCSRWFASDGTTGEAICDCGLAAEDTVAGLYHHDLGAILRALGVGDFARSESPHMVVHDVVLPAIRRLRAAPTPDTTEALCGAILNCSKASGHTEEEHERADGIVWHWHETVVPHRSDTTEATLLPSDAGPYYGPVVRTEFDPDPRWKPGEHDDLRRHPRHPPSADRQRQAPRQEGRKGLDRHPQGSREIPEGAQAMNRDLKRLRRAASRAERRWQRRSNAWVAASPWDEDRWASLTADAMYLYDRLDILADNLSQAASQSPHPNP